MVVRNYQVTILRKSDKELHEIEVFDSLDEVENFIKRKINLSCEIYEILVQEYKTEVRTIHDLCVFIPENK